MKLKVLSYNIHKGLSIGNRRLVLREIKEAIHPLHPDLVCLQEVLERHDSHASRFSDWPNISQFEYIADTLWPHFAYGRNAIYTEGNHGNAILSKFAFSQQDNIDISTNRFEHRGILHGIIPLPNENFPLHVICLHLNLMESDRMQQITQLCKRITTQIPHDHPLIVTGDFNDWRQNISRRLQKEISLSEVFLQLQGKHARTFPGWLPALALDRIYFRGLQPISAQCLNTPRWRNLSDHLPILAEFDLLPKTSWIKNSSKK